MRLFSDYGRPEADPGQWFDFQKAKADDSFSERTGEPTGIRFKIRPIPAGKQREIEASIMGHKREVRIKGGARIEDYDSERTEAGARRKAAFALVESEGCEIDAADDEAAREYTAMLGCPVKAGDLVKLDGKWTEQLKAYIFEKLPELMYWIAGRSDSLRIRADENESGKGRS